MYECRNNFFKAFESKLSSADFLLSNPELLKKKLQELEVFLQKNWPIVFSSLNDHPLKGNEKELLQKFIIEIENLNKRVGYKLSFFSDFQNYMKESIEK